MEITEHFKTLKIHCIIAENNSKLRQLKKERVSELNKEISTKIEKTYFGVLSMRIRVVNWYLRMLCQMLNCDNKTQCQKFV